MKKIGVIGAMDVEIELLVNRIHTYKKENIVGFDYYFGSFEDKTVIITCCGIANLQ